MKKKIWAPLFSLLAIAVLTGCAEMPPLNFSVPNVGPSSHRINAELRSLTVTLGRPDEKTGSMPVGIEVIVPMWKTALEEALNRMVIFRDDSKNRVSMAVKIVKMNVPSAGIAMETTSAARYEIIDRSNGDIIFTQVIDSEGIVPGGYAFVGAIRARESINRAVQNNISLFLKALETVDLKKPMFPSGRKPSS
tara:strand:+ start:47 stop:625 length:579 start_codon:yes stop_codon:yes gene_type:complete